MHIKVFYIVNIILHRPTSSFEACQQLKFPQNGLRAQSRKGMFWDGISPIPDETVNTAVTRSSLPHLWKQGIGREGWLLGRGLQYFCNLYPQRVNIMPRSRLPRIIKQTMDPKAEGTRGDLWRYSWISETGTNHPVAQLRDISCGLPQGGALQRMDIVAETCTMYYVYNIRCFVR